MHGIPTTFTEPGAGTLVDEIYDDPDYRDEIYDDPDYPAGICHHK